MMGAKQVCVGKPMKDLLSLFVCASFFAKSGRPLFADDAESVIVKSGIRFS
jgi:hypothetical protein